MACISGAQMANISDCGKSDKDPNQIKNKKKREHSFSTIAAAAISAFFSVAFFPPLRHFQRPFMLLQWEFLRSIAMKCRYRARFTLFPASPVLFFGRVIITYYKGPSTDSSRKWLLGKKRLGREKANIIAMGSNWLHGFPLRFFCWYFISEWR